MTEMQLIAQTSGEQQREAWSAIVPKLWEFAQDHSSTEELEDEEGLDEGMQRRF